MLNIKKMLTKIAKCCYTTGTDNGWIYRKYADGTFEAWRRYNATGLKLTTASAGTYYGSGTDGEKALDLPSFTSGITAIFGQEDNVYSHSSGLFIFNMVHNQSTSKLIIRFRAHASTSSGVCGVSLYIRGVWN